MGKYTLNKLYISESHRSRCSVAPRYRDGTQVALEMHDATIQGLHKISDFLHHESRKSSKDYMKVVLEISLEFRTQLSLVKDEAGKHFQSSLAQ